MKRDRLNKFKLLVSLLMIGGALASVWLFPHRAGHHGVTLVRWIVGLGGLTLILMEFRQVLSRRSRKGVHRDWWRDPLTQPDSTPHPTAPPGRVKLWLLPVLMLGWIPLMVMASSLWEVLLVVMGVACWQQAQTLHRGWLRASAEQLAWLFADVALIVLFPRNGEVGTFSFLGVAAVGSLAWMMLVARGQWRLLWAGLFVMLGAIPMAARVLRLDGLLWAELALGVALLAIMPALTRIEKAPVAPWPQNQPTQARFWRRLLWMGLCVGLGWWLSGLLTRPSYAFNLGAEDVNQSGPHDDGGDTIVFAVRIGRQDSDAEAKLYDTSDWYWRGNVLYTLDGPMWRRPAARLKGYNADYPYPVHTTWKDNSLRYYLVTWAGKMGTRVWLDRPVSSTTIDGGDVTLAPAEPSTAPAPPRPVGEPPPPPPEDFTRDGILREDQFPTTSWRPWFYPGIAALNQPIQDSGQRAEDLAWALNLTQDPIETMDQARIGSLENPRTRALAQKVFDRLPQAERGRPEVFAKAWLAYLDGHSVYDLDRTAAGAKHDVADAFLFGASTPHGTCVDFATSTVIALRQVGIPARYVTGFQGATWNPYLKTWVVTNGDAHAWVEYFQPINQSWVRLDPTFAIHRVIKTNPPIRNWAMWLQSLTNNHLSPIRAATQGPKQANLLAWLADIPLPTVHLAMWVRVATVVSLGSFLIVLTLLMIRRWRKTHPESWEQRRLIRTLARAQKRVAQRVPAAGRHRHEGLSAWADRVTQDHPELGDWTTLARATQRFQYGPNAEVSLVNDLRRQWQRVGRHGRTDG